MTYLKTYILLTLGLSFFIPFQDLKAQGRMDMDPIIPSEKNINTIFAPSADLSTGSLKKMSSNFSETSDLASFLSQKEKVQISRSAFVDKGISLKFSFDKSDSDLKGPREKVIFINNDKIQESRNSTIITNGGGYLIQDKFTSDWIYVSDQDVQKVVLEMKKIPSAWEASGHLINQTALMAGQLATFAALGIVELTENVSHNTGVYARRCLNNDGDFSLGKIVDGALDDEGMTMNFSGTLGADAAYQGWLDGNHQDFQSRFQLLSVEKFKGQSSPAFGDAVVKLAYDKKAEQQKTADELAQKKASEEFEKNRAFKEKYSRRFPKDF